VEDFLRGIVEALALLGEPELLLAPVDDEDVEVTLHGAELLAYRGLGDAVQLRGPRKAFALDEVGKDFKIFDVHGGDGLVAMDGG
jgi:hypothetical protein